MCMYFIYYKQFMRMFATNYLIIFHFIISLFSLLSSLPLTKNKMGFDQLTNLNSNKQVENYDREPIRKQVNNWSDNDNINVWELSGLFEGDIVINNVDTNVIAKNGLINKTMQWTYGIIPYMIDSNDFDKDDVDKIQQAIDEFHSNTCLQFRSYNRSDKNYITFQASGAGCYSSVGRQTQYQIINLQKPKCLKLGTIVHEILHAIGFYHQQSTFNRDDYVTIYWDNIKSGKEHNFKKYTSDTVTDYDVGYDYKSIMHYSSKAFSKNGNITIAPTKENVIIGQRKQMSKKDISKLQIMYENECEKRFKLKENIDFPLIIIN